MRSPVLTGLLVALIGLTSTSLALAQRNPGPPQRPPAGDAERGNLSGLRGLDRADEAAGEHGREGRGIARENVMRGGDRPERFNRPERSQRPDTPMRPDRPGRRGR